MSSGIDQSRTEGVVSSPVDVPPVGDEEFEEAPRRSKRKFGVVFWISAVWIAIVVLAALTADILPIPSPSDARFELTNEPPGAEALLGTDDIGRDILSRIIYGGRVSLTVGLLAIALGLTVGTAFGLLSGYFRGRVDSAVTVLTDSMLAFPPLVLILALTAALGQSQRNLTIGIGIITIPVFIRLSRANTMVFAQREFVTAAKAMGAKDGRIMFREVLPNVMLPIAAFMFLAMAVVIVAEGSLSFLGLGVPSPTPSWGGMIARGRGELESAPHVALIPSLVMFQTVVSFNFIGDTLRSRLDVGGGPQL